MAKRISRQQIASAFSEQNAGAVYPPVLTPSQAIELLQISKTKFYELKNEGLFDRCHRKRGAVVLYWRDGLIDSYFNGAGHG